MKNGKAWTMQLLAVACLSLAAKMEEIDVPLSLDLQVRETHLHPLLSSFLCLIFLDFSVLDDLNCPKDLDFHSIKQVAESKFVFEARTIQRMELLVLSTLRWRMQAVTPFSFIDSFLLQINEDQIPLRASILRSSQLILTTAKGTAFSAICYNFSAIAPVL